MKNGKMLTVLFALILITTGAMVFTADESDAANYTAKVYLDGDKTTGSGSSLKNVIMNAAGEDLVVAGNNNITSYKGVTAESGKAWVLFHWNAMYGWQVVNMGSNSTLNNGSTYAVHLSTATTSGGNTTYSVPNIEPKSTAYFYIKFTEQYDSPYVLNLLTEEQRKIGFWISGEGSDAAEAFQNACDRYQFEVNMNTGGMQEHNSELKGWLGTFMYMEDELVDPIESVWMYWTQYTWNGSAWKYNDLTLGHYDPGVDSTFAVIRHTTTITDMGAGLTISGNNPSPISPNSVWNTSPQSITLNYGSLSVFVGDTAKLTYSISPSNTTNKNVEWTSSDTSVATVNGGTVTALKEGTATITVKTVDGGKTAMCNVTVSQKATEGYALSMSNANLKVGEVLQISSTLKTNSWTSSDSSVASIDSSGKVKGLKEGTTTITGKSSTGDTATCVIIVRNVVGDLNGMLADTTVNKEGDTVTSETKVSGSLNGTVLTVLSEAISEVSTQLDSVKKMGSTINMNVIIEGNSAETVKINSVKALAQTGTNLMIRSSQGDINIPNGVLSGINDDSLTIEIKRVNINALNDKQKKKVNENDVIVNVTASNSKGSVHELDGKVTVTFDYVLPEGKSANDLVVWYLKDDGTLEKTLSATYKNGKVSFETDHFSLFMVGFESSGGAGISMTLIIISAVIIGVVAVIAIVFMMRRRKSPTL